MLTLHPKYGINGSQISNFLSKNKFFKGCYPIDRIPVFSSFPTYIVINTAPSGSSGEHWLALIIRKYDFLYFDSYGIGVVNYQLLKYFKQYGRKKPIVYSRVCIQDITSLACGLFVIAFCKHVKSKKSYHLFIDQFNHENVILNDLIVQKFL